MSIIAPVSEDRLIRSRGQVYSSKELFQETRRREARKRSVHYFKETNPNYEINWHHLVTSIVLDRMMFGTIRNAIFLGPPRMGKSEQITINFPGTIIGNFPNHKIIAASYGDDLSKDFAIKTHDTLESEQHKYIYPDFSFRDDNKSIQHWKTIQKGEYNAVGIMGAITGKGANWFIVDDPIKNQQEAASRVYRDRLWDWWRRVANTRMEPDGRKIIAMTRWHKDDLVGRLLKEEPEEWYVVTFPAIAERKENFRDVGESLWPNRRSAEEFQKIRRSVGGLTWASMYQQRPEDEEGGLCRRHWFQYYDELPCKLVPDEFEYAIFHSWDTAFETGDSNSYTVCVVAVLYQGNLYIINVFRERMEYPELKNAVRRFYQKDKPRDVIVEKKASGQSLLQELKRKEFMPLKGIEVTKNKIERFREATPFVEAGSIYLKQGASWVDDFVDELVGFPNSDFDDQVDSFSQLVIHVKKYIEETEAFSMVSFTGESKWR